MKGSLPALGVLAMSSVGSFAQADVSEESPLDSSTFESLRDENAAMEPHLDDTNHSTLHSSFAAGFAWGTSFSAPPQRKQVDETLWNLQLSIGLPFEQLEGGTFGAAFEFDVSYPVSFRTASGQNTHRFRFDPRATYAREAFFFDHVSLVLNTGLGFGLERIQFPRSTFLAYGALAAGGWTAYFNTSQGLARLSPFSRMAFRYRPTFSKFKTSDSLSDAEIADSAEGSQTAFSSGGRFSFASVGFDVGVSSSRGSDGTRLMTFLGVGREWHHFKALRRNLSKVGPSGRTSSTNVEVTSLRLGVERGF
ncbi:MAG: hypothetical protein IOD12_06060 [Silvanigrellales bacterium]|nr:hypothetical protein [Silvanigrellales bacterium]